MTDPTDALQRFSSEQVLAFHALADAMYLEEESFQAIRGLLTASEIMTLFQTAISQVLTSRRAAPPSPS